MRKKKVRFFITIAVLQIIALISIFWSLASLVKIRRNYEHQIEINNSLIKDKEIIEDKLNETKNKLEESNKKLEESNTKIESLEKDQQRIKEEYDALNKKYQEEMKPVAYNRNNLLEPSNITLHKMQIALKGTGLQGLENSYIQAELETGVNAIFLASL